MPVMVKELLEPGTYHRSIGREGSDHHYCFKIRGVMRKNYRRKNKPVVTKTFPQLTIQDFESYCAIQLDDMVKADRYTPGVENYGVQPFSALGLRDEGYGVVVRCKDGSAFMLNIKPLSEFGKD